MPPLLILHGRADRLVPEHQSALLFEAVAVRNGTALFYSIPELEHERGRNRHQEVHGSCLMGRLSWAFAGRE